jgi:hypothetical protein
MLVAPSFGQILEVAASRGARSYAPNLWRGLVGAWPLQESDGDKAYDASGYGNHGMLTGMDPATDHVLAEQGRALTSAGSPRYVDCGGSFSQKSTGATSVSAWVKGQGNNVYVATNVITEFNGPNGYGLAIGADYQGNFGAIIAKTFNTYYLINVSGHDSSIWTHYCAVFAPSKGLYLYRNGVLIGANTASPPASQYRPPDPILLFKRPDGVSFFIGEIFHCLIHERELSLVETQQLYYDPWAMYRMRRRVFAAAAVGGLLVHPGMSGGLPGMSGGLEG